jgi:hypothetical protein
MIMGEKNMLKEKVFSLPNIAIPRQTRAMVIKVVHIIAF